MVSGDEHNFYIDELKKNGYIPLKYHTDFIDLIADNPNIFQVITYKDLKWQKSDSADSFYPAEKRAWDEAMRKGELDGRKIYVLIQHDVDSQPQRTMSLLKYEAQKGVPTNVMIFNRRVNRRYFVSSGKVEFTDYILDFDLLRKLQEQDFVIGYHMNAFEQSAYNINLAREFFLADIEELGRANFEIKFFSAHGGAPGPDGINNRDINLQGIEKELIWVHNGKTPIFDGNYSDGGLNSLSRDPAKRDLRDFVKKWTPGKRYRVLTHPQYYHVSVKSSIRLSEASWYRDVLDEYCDATNSYRVWAPVRSEFDKKLTMLPSSKFKRIEIFLHKLGFGKNEFK